MQLVFVMLFGISFRLICALASKRRFSYLAELIKKELAIWLFSMDAAKIYSSYRSIQI